jgi:hypothetical protein
VLIASFLSYFNFSVQVPGLCMTNRFRGAERMEFPPDTATTSIFSWVGEPKTLFYPAMTPQAEFGGQRKLQGFWGSKSLTRLSFWQHHPFFYLSLHSRLCRYPAPALVESSKSQDPV